MANAHMDAAVDMAAKNAGLVIVSAESLSIRRRRTSRGFVYAHIDGREVRNRRIVARLDSLAVPPAYEDVWFASEARAHLQAIGRDAAGRLQYRYHPKWETVRESLKIDRLAATLRSLPAIRASVSKDVSRRKTDRRKALAMAVALIDATHMRIGCEEYARSNKSFGVATLLRRHVDCSGETIALSFSGKGGKDISCRVRSAQLARALRRMAALPGKRLLMFRDEAGRARCITSRDVNEYLAEIAGAPVTAKDLRALGACAAAARRLVELDPAESERQRRRQVAGVMRSVSERLANTPAIVRKSYVHAVVVKGFETGELHRAYEKSRSRGAVRRVERALSVLVDAAE